MQVRAFKLITGELVIAKTDGIIGLDNTIKLHKPQTLFVQQDRENRQMVGFTDFAPFIKGDNVSILVSTIQCQGEAEPQITQGYLQLTTGLELPAAAGGIILPT